MNDRLATVPTPASSKARWETEVFVLGGADRKQLRRRIDEFRASLKGGEDAEPAELASSCADTLEHGGKRLAIVAGGLRELSERLARASQRLEAPDCVQINDSQGIYFFDKPLGPQGGLAFLFPGEGSPYLNMAADLLPHFPEVREHYDLCDRISLAVGQHSEPISRRFFVPENLAESERKEAERRLGSVRNAVAGALVTNWAFYRILGRLGLQPTAVAGHSSGEISALAAAGCIEADDGLFARLFALGDVLEEEESQGHIAESILLGVAAGRDQVAAVIDGTSGTAFIAIDNCPHQTVVAGPAEKMVEVEQQLTAKGILHDRLPIRRPYHTPLFADHVEPIAAMFRSLDFRPPRIPVYSCTTGRRFPEDPERIRRLAVEHWTSCVQFTGLVRRMYEENVRVFVEVGPRGNLTSFVEDILRRHPVAALAANVPHQSGITRLNHVVGQLVAHHVPVDLRQWYDRRPFHSRSPGAGAPAPRPSAGSPREAVVLRHFQVMEQFLQLQGDIQRRFVERVRRVGRPSPGDRPPGQATPKPTAPMFGKIVRHEPGQLVVMRRLMDLDEDLYAGDHTLGGRDASAVDANYHGLAVMPMAFSLEMMAEVASFLIPDRLTVEFRNVLLRRWIPLFEEPVTLEVTALVVPGGHVVGGLGKTTQVAIEIRDLGNGRHPGPQNPSVEATVVLAEHYPAAPLAEEFALSGERRCRLGYRELYESERRLFHGPRFRAVDRVVRMGDEGIEGSLVALSHAALFRSTSRPNLLLDPILIDASTHILGCWHLSLPDQTGRVVFPYQLGKVQFFGPPPAKGSQVDCRVTITDSSARQVSHRIDLLGSEGSLWCRIDPAEYWRFYWPAEYVAFFRHHEAFRVCTDWSSALPVPAADVRTASADGPNEAVCVKVSPPFDIVEPVVRAALARVSLSPGEWQQFYGLTGADRERTDWLFARIAAKDCIRTLWEKRYGQRLFPADLEIKTDKDGRATACLRGRPDAVLPRVSIACADKTIAALAAFGRCVGLALARIDARDSTVELTAFDDQEQELLDRFGDRRDEVAARFRCAKEALAKALGPEKSGPPWECVVCQFDPATNIVWIRRKSALAAADASSENRFAVRTVRNEDLVAATILAFVDEES